MPPRSVGDRTHALTATAAISAEALPRLIAERARNSARFILAIAGPPGAGKSTLAGTLADTLNREDAGPAIVVPMDGFHYDNAVLAERGLLARKGAPETFDVDGLAVLLRRLRDPTAEVAIPLFDRTLDLARAGAAIVTPAHRILLVEGNYLLVDEAPWSALRALFDLTIAVDLPLEELEKRLVRRWRDHGYDPDAALTRALSNDMPNAHFVLSHSRQPDLVV